MSPFSTHVFELGKEHTPDLHPFPLAFIHSDILYNLSEHVLISTHKCGALVREDNDDKN